MSSFQAINYCQGEGGKMMNLFKAFNLCVCARAIWDVEIAQQLGLFMLVWAKTFSCVLNLPSFEKQDLITRSSWILNVFATVHMKLNWLWRRAPQDVAAGVTDACTCPTKRFDYTLNDIPLMNFKQPSECPMDFPKKVSKWKLNFEWLWIVIHAKNKTLSSHTLGTYYLWSANK